MKTPRDLSGADLIVVLSKYGYEVVRQKGSHVRLTTLENGEHHITIPLHNPLKLGTLSAILQEIAEHFEMSKKELLDNLFD